MKNNFRRIAALLLVLVLVISSALPAFAAGQPSSYSTSRNSGERDVVCTTLDGTRALSYYTGDYTYDKLSELSSSALLTSLRTLMKTTHKTQTSYSDCKNYADETDCENGNSTIITIYTSYASSQGEYNSGNGWNREHVWPKSLGGFNTSGAGADLHHIRPSENKTNGDRGNLKYGEVSGGKTTVGNLSGIVGGACGSYFEPLDNVKGDVARICLYVYVRYGGELSKCNSITNVFQSVDVLLDWCELDPVDTWEMGRNEVVGKIQGNRNVFIDYPEFAWLLFGREIPSDMTTPSGEAKGGSGSSGSDTPVVCQHTSTVIKNAVTATCGRNGYTGDTYCASCNAKISSGTSIPKSENHTWGEPTVTVPPTATTEGEQEELCEVCGELQITSIPKLGEDVDDKPGTDDDKETCKHTDTVVKNVISATCAKNGYTGDTYCAECDELISRGRTLFATGKHEWSEPEIITPPTETENGVAKETCTVCGKERTVDISYVDPGKPDDGTDEVPDDGTDKTPDDGTGDTPDDGSDPVIEPIGNAEKIIISIAESFFYGLFIESL